MSAARTPDAACGYIDTHSHIDVDTFDADRAEVIARALEAGVAQQVVPAVDAAGWDKLLQVCRAHAGLHAALGLHPVYLEGHDESHLHALAQRLGADRPIAVGECGLDYFIDSLDRDRQQRFFDRQLELAREHDLPVIVHARRAVDAVIASIRRIGGLRGVVHSFSGSLEQARQLNRNGFLLGLGGPLTYPRANRLRSVAAAVPLDWLLLETDSPDQPDCMHRGQRNEPARLPQVAQTLADLRGCTLDDIARATTANAQRLFGPALAMPD